MAQTVLGSNGGGGFAIAGVVASFAPVKETDWCGEWVLRPSSLQ